MPDILPYFTERGTRRRFDSARHISADDIKAIVGAAAHAPNTGNMQLYTIVATIDPSAKKELAGLHFNQPAATGADVLLTVCADTRRFGRWCRCRQAENSLDNPGGRLTAAVDAAIVAQQIVTVAETAGLATCYLGTATYNAEAIGRLLDLPKGVVPIVGIAMGYPLPDDTPAPADRLPVDAVLHMERYHDGAPTTSMPGMRPKRLCRSRRSSSPRTASPPLRRSTVGCAIHATSTKLSERPSSGL